MHSGEARISETLLKAFGYTLGSVRCRHSPSIFVSVLVGGNSKFKTLNINPFKFVLNFLFDQWVSFFILTLPIFLLDFCFCYIQKILSACLGVILRFIIHFFHI